MCNPEDVGDGEDGFHRHLHHHRNREHDDGASNRRGRVVDARSAKGLADRGKNAVWSLVRVRESGYRHREETLYPSAKRARRQGASQKRWLAPFPERCQPPFQREKRHKLWNVSVLGTKMKGSERAGVPLRRASG